MFSQSDCSNVEKQILSYIVFELLSYGSSFERVGEASDVEFNRYFAR